MSPTTAAPKPSPSALHSALHSAVGRPANRACFVLTLGLDLGLTSGAIRRYTIPNAPDTALRAVAQNLNLWSKLTTSAARKVAGSNSSVGQAALRREVAGRLVGRLVLPAAIPTEKDTDQPRGGLEAENSKSAIRDTGQPKDQSAANGEAGGMGGEMAGEGDGMSAFAQPMRSAAAAARDEADGLNGQSPEGSELADGDEGQRDTGQRNGRRLDGGESVLAEAGKLAVRDTVQRNGRPAGGEDVGVKPLFTQRRVVSARYAMAVIGTDWVRGTSDGFEGDFVNELNLAVRTGTSPAAARANLKALEAMGWLTCTKKQKGSAAKYKLAPLPKKVESAALPFLGVVELLGDRTMLEASAHALSQTMSFGGDSDDEVDEDLAAVLADQPVDAYACQVLESAPHAAWGYSRPSAKADRIPGAPADLVTRDWVYLWAVATGADPASMGLSMRECTSARRDMRLAQVGPSHPGTLTEQLDRVAAQTGATDRYRAAWAARNEAKAKRANAVRSIQTQAGRNQAGPGRLKVVVDRIATGMPPVPHDGPSKQVLMDWLRSANVVARTELEGGPGVDGGPDRLPSWTASPDLLRDGLAVRFTAAGYDEIQSAALSRAAVPS